MNTDQIQGLIRAALVALFGGTLGVWLVKHGITVDDSFITMASGLIVGLGSVVWSLVTKTQAATVKKAAAIVPISDATQRSVGIDNPVTPAT